MKEDFEIPVEYMELLTPIRKKQIELTSKLVFEDRIEFGEIRTIAGLDVAYSFDESFACAGIVIIDFRSFDIIEEHVEIFNPPIPYISSFLFQRESPGYFSVLKKVEEKPDVLIFDGNGIIHPFGCGLACQMGLETNVPSFGIAKTLLFGEYTPPLKSGGYSLIKKEENIIGAAFQTLNPPANPVFVSPGHLINLYTTVNIMREFVYFQKYDSKLPLPLQLVDKLVNDNLSG